MDLENVLKSVEILFPRAFMGCSETSLSAGSGANSSATLRLKHLQRISSFSRE